MRRLRALVLIASTFLLVPAAARAITLANVIDLRTAGSTGSANGVLFDQETAASTVGYFDSFLGVNGPHIEEAFNTDYRSNGIAPLNAVSSTGNTHSLSVGSLQSVAVNGVDYYVFSLSVDEPATSAQRYVSLDQIRIYLAGAPNLADLAGSALVYNLDAAGDATIYLDGASGTGAHMRMLISTSYFAAANPGDYVYLYSKLGATAHMGSDIEGLNGGFEQWSALRAEAQTSEVFEPSSLALLGCGLLGFATVRRGKQ